MKCHILRWNPNISTHTEQIHLNSINAILKGELNDFNWSVYNWKEVKGGDFWILQRVGTDEDGIAGFGRFAGLPYESNSWRKDGTKLYFSKLNVWCLIDRTVSKTLSAKELEKEFPEINWHGGHSGEMVSEDTAEKLFLKLFTHFMGNLGPNPIEAFDSSCEEDIQDNFIDYLKRMAPKFCREFYETQDCICTNCNKICNPKPKYKDVSLYYKCGGDSLSKYPENPTLKDFENYLELNAFCEDCDAEHDDDFYNKSEYPLIENHETIKKYFGCYFSFHDCYITDFIINADSAEIRICADQWLAENVSPCLVCIKINGITKINELSIRELDCQPLFNLETEKLENGLRILCNGTYLSLDCKQAEFKIENKKQAKYWGCWRSNK